MKCVCNWDRLNTRCCCRNSFAVKFKAELEFFELFCTVDKVGTRKALKALIRPIREIADAIQRQDPKWLTALPGVGAATAEQIVATLRRKVTKFALMPAPREGDSTPSAASAVDGN